MANVELAQELLKACAGDKGCRLPKRIRTISRNGMSMQLIDDLASLWRGAVGLELGDQFIANENPRGLVRSARVYRADGQQPCRSLLPQIPPDRREPVPQEHIFGSGPPDGKALYRTDGLPAQSGDLYVDITDPARRAYVLTGPRTFAVPAGAPYDIDELAFDQAPDGSAVPPAPTQADGAARRPGDAFYDPDGQGSVYEWTP
jgi:hypothetical protein